MQENIWLAKCIYFTTKNCSKYEKVLRKNLFVNKVLPILFKFIVMV